MVKFPKWVTMPRKQSDDDLQRKKLRYLLSRAAIEATEEGTFKALAELAGIDRSQFSIYLGQGAFNVAMAKAVEGVVGRAVVRAEWLVFPLAVAEE